MYQRISVCSICSSKWKCEVTSLNKGAKGLEQLSKPPHPVLYSDHFVKVVAWPILFWFRPPSSLEIVSESQIELSCCCKHPAHFCVLCVYVLWMAECLKSLKQEMLMSNKHPLFFSFLNKTVALSDKKAPMFFCMENSIQCRNLKWEFWKWTLQNLLSCKNIKIFSSISILFLNTQGNLSIFRMCGGGKGWDRDKVSFYNAVPVCLDLKTMLTGSLLIIKIKPDSWKCKHSSESVSVQCSSASQAQ